MNLKGNQLKRVRRYRSADPFKRKVARFKHAMNKQTKVPVAHGLFGYIDVNKQMTQPLPATIDKDAWGRDFDTMALCKLFGVPYEIYEASQTNKL